jgi:hypothetical protein
MPIALIIEIINALLAVAPQIPAVVSLAESAIGIVKTGAVSPAEEAAIRAQLDTVKALVDAG